MRGQVNIHIVTRLMTRGITTSHPGFSAAYEQEATRAADDAAMASFQRWWSRLAPQRPVPRQNNGDIVCGTWTSDEAARCPALQDILHRVRHHAKPERIDIRWRAGSDHLTVHATSGSGQTHTITVRL